MHTFEDQTRKQLINVLLDQRSEINVIPRLVFAARHENEPRNDTRHLHDRMQRLAPALRLGTHEQIMALVQELRERMAGVDSEGRQHRKDFFLKITMRPGRAFGVQLRYFADANSILGKLREQFIVPKRILGRDQLAYDSPDAVECFGRTQSIGADVARLALDLLFDSGDTNLEEFVQVRAENGEKLHSLDQRLRRVLRFFKDAAIKFKPAQLAVDEVCRIGKSAHNWNIG